MLTLPFLTVMATCHLQSKYAQTASSGKKDVTNGYLAVHTVLGAYDST
jgi:hypothetical protein